MEHIRIMIKIRILVRDVTHHVEPVMDLIAQTVSLVTRTNLGLPLTTSRNNVRPVTKQ